MSIQKTKPHYPFMLMAPVKAAISDNGHFHAKRKREDNSYKIHQGLDYKVGKGTPVKASFGGKVIRASERVAEKVPLLGKDKKPLFYKDGKPMMKSLGSFGNLVIIEHTEEIHNHRSSSTKSYIYTLYAHLDKFNVKLHDKVYRGKVIGYSGNTGTTEAYDFEHGRRTTEGGYHLHFEVIVSKTKLVWYSTGNTGVKPHVGRVSPSRWLDKDLVLLLALTEDNYHEELQDKVRDRIQDVMELVPTVSRKNRYWRMDVMVYGKNMGYLDTRNKELVLEFTVDEALEILSKPITKRTTEYHITG